MEIPRVTKYLIQVLAVSLPLSLFLSFSRSAPSHLEFVKSRGVARSSRPAYNDSRRAEEPPVFL